MADFFKNSDYFDCARANRIARGIQYDTVVDLATEPVDLQFFEDHAKIDFDTDDTLCEAYIKAARQELEKWSQLSFGVKTMRLRALELPDNFRLMYGRVDTVTTPGYTNFGDILKEGGYYVDIEYTTIGIMNEDIKVAICRKAASIYLNRETKVNSKYQAAVLEDEAKEMVRPYMNVTLF